MKRINAKPGPGDTWPELAGPRQPLVHHHEAVFQSAAREVKENVRKYMGSSSATVTMLNSSGTGAMHTSIVSLTNPYETVFVAINGIFSQKYAARCRQHGNIVNSMEVPLGEAINPDKFRSALADCKPMPKIAYAVLTDTSNGVVSDAKALTAVAHEFDIPIVFDGVCSWFNDPFKMDEWGVDGFFSAPQKGLRSTPGLGFLALNKRLMDLAKKIHCTCDYFDVKQYLEGKVFFTPDIPAIFDAQIALRAVGQFGGVDAMINSSARKAEVARRLLRELGLKFVARKGVMSNALTVVRAPEGIEADKIRELAEARGVLLGESLTGEEVFRFSHFSSTTEEDMVTVCHVLREVLVDELGYVVRA